MLGSTVVKSAVRSLFPFTLLLSLPGLGCAPTARLHVTKPLEVKLQKYDSVNVTATGSPAAVARAAREFEKVLGERLKREKLFASVDSDGELVVAARITQMNFGDANPREFALKGKASATIEVRITKPDGTLLGHVTVRATARKKNADDQPAQRVLKMAADEVVEYLAERAAATAPPSKGKGKAAPSGEGADGKGKASLDVSTDEGDDETDGAAADDEEPSPEPKSDDAADTDD